MSPLLRQVGGHLRRWDRAEVRFGHFAGEEVVLLESVAGLDGWVRCGLPAPGTEIEQTPPGVSFYGIELVLHFTFLERQ